MRLTDYLHLERIRLPIKAVNKRQAIEELAGLLSADGSLQTPERAVRAVLRRERTRSTGIGSGIALPHARTTSAEELLIAFGRTESPIDFQSVDGERADLIFLVLGPKAVTAMMIQALARITRLMGNERIRDQLRGASTPLELHAIIARHDRKRETAEGE